MSEITILNITLLTVMLIGGGVLGWIIRANRCASEKATINAGWKEQLNAQQTEHERLVEQNRSLMQRISQYQASEKDSTKRAKELADALKDASDRSDELQQQLNNIRNDFEAAIARRDELQQEIEAKNAQNVAAAEAVKQRNQKIFKLSRELESWQSRLPPLLEKFRERSEAAERLEEELASAREQIGLLETTIGTGQTHVHAITRDSLRDNMDASNDPSDATHNILPVATDGDDRDNEPVSEDIDFSMHRPEFAYHADRETTQAFGKLRDNLQLIKGIGPSIEKTLNEMGIFRFGQIADMSEYDIDRVANRLKGLHSRIYREDWIGQARELRERKRADHS